MHTLLGDRVSDSLLAQSSSATRLVWSQAARPFWDEQGPSFSTAEGPTPQLHGEHTH